MSQSGSRGGSLRTIWDGLRTRFKITPMTVARRCTPSYAGYRPASASSSKAMRGNRAQNTRPELVLREALKKYRLRYRRHDRTVLGRPDFVFPSARLAVFCDGDFWHGRRWAALRSQLEARANAAYWVAKISANRARDRRHRRLLRRDGWTVVRVWETDVLRRPTLVATKIASVARKIQGPGAAPAIRRGPQAKLGRASAS
jgi:DNA mismatch endonuclease (patch repair protein)